MNRPIVALMYDFDKTLSPKNMQDYGFIKELGVKPADFWKECDSLRKKHQMDEILAYMYLMLEKGQSNFVLRRENFQKLGSSVKLFPGVQSWFSRINGYCKEKNLVCEHYIISSGLKEIIEGTTIAGEFKEIYAGEFMYGENKLANWPAMAINYTSKTQFLFRINKGVLDVTEQSTINRYVPEEDRRVPFRNMIYIGDGDTDVPCMSLTKRNGGHSIAVYEKDSSIAKRLINENRVDFALPANYRKGSVLEKTVFKIIDKISATEILKQAGMK